MITANPVRFAEIRQRLSSVSWFMRCLVEQSLQREREQRGCRVMQGLRYSRTVFF